MQLKFYFGIKGLGKHFAKRTRHDCNLIERTFQAWPESYKRDMLESIIPLKEKL